jgi:hypothetical protein
MAVGFGLGIDSSLGALVGTGGRIGGWQSHGSSQLHDAGRLVHM